MATPGKRQAVTLLEWLQYHWGGLGRVGTVIVVVTVTVSLAAVAGVVIALAG